MEDGGCQKMIMDGYFLALLSIYNSRDVSSKNLANKERNNCPELENRACEPPRQPALRPAIFRNCGLQLLAVFLREFLLIRQFPLQIPGDYCRSQFLVSAGRNFGVFLVTSCFLH